MIAPSPSVDLFRQAGALSNEGAALASAFMDTNGPPKAESRLGVLASNPGTISAGKPWPVREVEFLHRAIRALVGVAGGHLSGIARLFATAPPLGLFPVMALVRGVAEACGKIWWLMEPWLDETGAGRTPSQAGYNAACSRVLSRTQVLHLNSLADRRRRVEASFGQTSAQYQETQSLITAYKTILTDLHGTNLVVTGRRTEWRVCGEPMPPATNMVEAVSEYAYGQSFRGTGINPYPLYSGFAHGSVELIFAHDDRFSGAPLSQLVQADAEEALKLLAIACRTFAAGMELACQPLHEDLGPLNSWENEVNGLVVVP